MSRKLVCYGHIHISLSCSLTIVRNDLKHVHCKYVWTTERCRAVVNLAIEAEQKIETARANKKNRQQEPNGSLHHSDRRYGILDQPGLLRLDRLHGETDTDSDAVADADADADADPDADADKMDTSYADSNSDDDVVRHAGAVNASDSTGPSIDSTGPFAGVFAKVWLRISGTCFVPIDNFIALRLGSLVSYKHPIFKAYPKVHDGVKPTVLEFPRNNADMGSESNSTFPTSGTKCFVAIGTVGAPSREGKPAFIICAVPCTERNGVQVRYLATSKMDCLKVFIGRQKKTDIDPIRRDGDNGYVILFDDLVYKFNNADERTPPRKWLTHPERHFCVQNVPQLWALAEGRKPPPGGLRASTSMKTIEPAVRSVIYNPSMAASFFAGDYYTKRNGLQPKKGSRRTTAQRSGRPNVDCSGLSEEGLHNPHSWLKCHNLREELIAKQIQGLGETKITRRQLVNLVNTQLPTSLEQQEQRNALLYQIFADLSWQLIDDPPPDPDRIVLKKIEVDHDFISATITLQAPRDTSQVPEMEFLKAWTPLLKRALAGDDDFDKCWNTCLYWFSKELIMSRKAKWSDPLAAKKNAPRHRASLACCFYMAGPPFNLAVALPNDEDLRTFRELCWKKHLIVYDFLVR